MNGSDVRKSASYYSLTIMHVTPLNGSALVHVRLVHSSAAHSQQHMPHSMLQEGDLDQVQVGIRVGPELRDIHIDAATQFSNRWTTDVLVSNLRDGQEYTLQSWSKGPAGEVAIHRTRRTTSLRPGCFNENMAQCCGNGICITTDDVAVAHCKCLGSYVGPLCDILGTHPIETFSGALPELDMAVTCPAHFPHHTTPLLANSGGSVGAERKVLNYCWYSDTPEASCCTSVEFMVRTNTGAGWTSAERLHVPGSAVLEGALQADVRDAVGGVVTSGAVVDVHVHFGNARREEGDVVVLPPRSYLRAAPSPTAPSRDTFLTAQLCGPSHAVRSTIDALVSQAANSSSKLRRGLLTSHIHPKYLAIVAHKSQVHKPHEVEDEGGGKAGIWDWQTVAAFEMWVIVFLLTSLTVFLFWKRTHVGK